MARKRLRSKRLELKAALSAHQGMFQPHSRLMLLPVLGVTMKPRWGRMLSSWQKDSTVLPAPGIIRCMGFPLVCVSSRSAPADAAAALLLLPDQLTEGVVEAGPAG